MSSQNQEELKRKVEEVKQDADVQHALQQATPTEKTGVRRVRASDIVWIATQLFFLIVVGALYTFLKYRLRQFAYAPLLKLLLAIGVVIVCVTALRLDENEAIEFAGLVEAVVVTGSLEERFTNQLAESSRVAGAVK